MENDYSHCRSLPTSLSGIKSVFPLRKFCKTDDSPELKHFQWIDYYTGSILRIVAILPKVACFGYNYGHDV